MLPLVSEGEPVRAMRVQLYQTPGTTQIKHKEEEVEQR
jgi:hypothetical protein